MTPFWSCTMPFVPGHWKFGATVLRAREDVVVEPVEVVDTPAETVPVKDVSKFTLEEDEETDATRL